MAGLRDLIRATQQDLPITVRHERWLAANSNATYSQAALEFAAKALAHDVGGARKRNRTFRASGLSSCERKRILQYLRVPEREQVESKTANIFHTGNFVHLKWQMAGLTEGWLVEAEVPHDSEELNFGSTFDGILYDGSGCEIKSINSRGYSNVMTYGPKPEHIMQVHGYMLLRPDIDKFSILYENKDNQEWREFRVQRSEAIIATVTEEIARLNGYLRDQELPPMLGPCVEKTGYTYRGCAFRDNCPLMQKWSDLHG